MSYAAPCPVLFSTSYQFFQPLHDHLFRHCVRIVMQVLIRYDQVCHRSNFLHAHPDIRKDGGKSRINSNRISRLCICLQAGDRINQGNRCDRDQGSKCDGM